MGRHREFEPAVALAAARALFHRQGFAATSMQQLVDTMGLGRASVYQTFGNKRALYAAALRSYTDDLAARFTRELENAEDPLAAVVELLRRSRGSTAERDRRLGCMLGNGCAERALHDEAIAALCAEGFARLEVTLAGALHRAQARGDLTDEKSPKALARFLVILMQGLAVVGKAQGTHAMVRDAVEIALSLLGGTGPRRRRGIVGSVGSMG